MKNYSGKLRNKLAFSDPASVWKGMKDITSYKTPSPSCWRINNWQTILMTFTVGLEKTPHTCPEHLSTQPSTHPATPLSLSPALKITEDDVRQFFRENKRRIAPGPDQPASKPVLTSWPPSSQRSSTDH